MRTIKFRGVRKYDGLWIFGDLLTDPDDEVSIQYYDEEDGWMCEYVNGNTVGQFTGVIDNKGKDIYEGDIVRVRISDARYKAHPRYKNLPVFFHEGRFDVDWFGAFHSRRLEVIGNVYDNPELLKGGTYDVLH